MKYNRLKFINKWRYEISIALILTLFSLFAVGCGKYLGLDNAVTPDRLQKNELSTDNQLLVNKISAKIREKKAAGFLAQVPAQLYDIQASAQNDATVVTDDASVGQKIDEFMNQPEKVLAEVANDEKGHEQLELIDSIFSEQSADIVADKMAQIDPKMKEIFLKSIQGSVESPQVEAQFISQGIMDAKTKKIDFSKLKLNLTPQPVSSVPNAIYEGSLNWSNINGYYGYCLVTLSGEAVYAFTPEWSGWTWTGWIRWIGLAAAIGGQN